jgi:uridine kinase
MVENTESYRFTHVIKRNGARVPFTPQRITNAIYRAAVAVEGRDREMAEMLTGKVIALLEKNQPGEQAPHIEQIQDAVEEILIENGHAKVAKAYILYRDERARMRRMREEQTIQPSGIIPWAKIWQVLDWAVSHNLHTIESYNTRLRNGELNRITTESEMFYEEDIKEAAEGIRKRGDQIKIVLISGPSSSGKTTTTTKLGKLLEQMRMRLVALNVDNYFFDLDKHPKDEFGDYDYETPQALDIALISEHLRRLIDGEEVMIPFYDFKTGRRFDDRTPMKIGERDVILIDSLHGLYPPMTGGIPDNQKFKIYIEPLLQMKDSAGKYIRWTDIRLMRRMLRDASYRAYNPEDTLTHWHYVRASELRNIIPNHIHADYIINSAMPYELSVYKTKLMDDFSKWMVKYRSDPLREDAFQRASRVHGMLDQFAAVEDDSFIPGDSVIREFIGGSSLIYH